MSAGNLTGVRDSAGRYARTSEPWTPENWDAGYLDNKGRCRVYRPDYPRAFPNGYAFRYHIVYWLATGKSVPVGSVLHHLNGVKTDDRLGNLELMEHGAHSAHHNKRSPRMLVCEHCGVSFAATKGYRPTRFCSQACYHAHKVAHRKPPPEPANAAGRGAHVRWHVQRGSASSTCRWCQEQA